MHPIRFQNTNTPMIPDPPSHTIPLPPEDWLSATSVAESHAPLSQEWEHEITRRLKELEDGAVAPVPFDDSLRRAYARIADLHAADARANA